MPWWMQEDSWHFFNVRGCILYDGTPSIMLLDASFITERYRGRKAKWKAWRSSIADDSSLTLSDGAADIRQLAVCHCCYRRCYCRCCCRCCWNTAAAATPLLLLPLLLLVLLLLPSLLLPQMLDHCCHCYTTAAAAAFAVRGCRASSDAVQSLPHLDSRNERLKWICGTIAHRNQSTLVVFNRSSLPILHVIYSYILSVSWLQKSTLHCFKESITDIEEVTNYKSKLIICGYSSFWSYFIKGAI